MDALTLVLIVLMGGSALVAHTRIAAFGAACLVAAYCSAPPSLVIFDLGGGSKTDFAPFNLFVLFWMALAISALVGAPFWGRRKLRGESTFVASVSNNAPAAPRFSALQNIAWIFSAGIATTLLLVALLNILFRYALEPTALAQPTLPLKIIPILLFSVSVVCLLFGAMLNGLFQTGIRLAGNEQPLPAQHEFWAGLSLSTTLLLLFVLTDHLAPPRGIKACTGSPSIWTSARFSLSPCCWDGGMDGGTPRIRRRLANAYECRTSRLAEIALA